MRGGPRIAAAALGVALASGLAAAAFASGTGGRTVAALVTLQVAPRGPGSISTSTAGGVDLDNGNAPIGGPCEQNVGEGACHWGFERGTTVTLTANSTGTGFTSWSSPDCPGTGSCTITLNDDLTSIVGIFNPLTLGVRLSSSSGTVTSDPAGIVCSNDGDDGCFHGFPPNTAVRLTVASADFKGWNGACTPADATTCTIVVNDQNTWAGATFGTDDPPSLETTIEVKFQLKKLGSGGGVVTAPNISCGSQCSSQFGYGKTLTLTATPDSTSIFGGWGGVCAQTQLTCTFAVGPITGIKTTFDRDAIPPTTPGDLKVTNTTLTGASIAWTASTDNLGVTGYRVYKDNVSAGGHTPAPPPTLTAPTCRWTSARPTRSSTCSPASATDTPHPGSRCAGNVSSGWSYTPTPSSTTAPPPVTPGKSADSVHRCSWTRSPPANTPTP